MRDLHTKQYIKNKRESESFTSQHLIGVLKYQYTVGVTLLGGVSQEAWAVGDFTSQELSCVCYYLV